jgi:fatty acid desaturase
VGYTCPVIVTIYGVCALSFMMAMYALETRDRRFVLAFALGCLLSSAYGFWSRTWPFGVVELVWSAIALRRFQQSGHASAG